MAFSKILGDEMMAREKISRIIKMCFVIAAGCMVMCGCSLDKADVASTEPSVSAGAVQTNGSSIETVCDELQNCNVDGVIYYQLNPENYNEISSAAISFGEVATEAIDSQRVKVTLPVSITMHGKYTEDCIDYSGCITPSFELFDRYTSVLFPVNTGVGDGSYNYGGSIISNNRTVDVSYTCDYDVKLLGWNANGDETFSRDIVYNVTYTVLMPADYDGLAIKVTPVTQYSTGISAPTGVTAYVQDDYPDGTRVFAVH